jgi:hypothetical protein
MDIHALKQTTLANVPADKAFVVCRGDRITHVKDLANCIESLNEGQFKHHVHPEKGESDWSHWIRNELRNPALAGDVNLKINLENKAHLVKTIRDHVAWLEQA